MSNEEISFLRTKSKVVLRHSLLIKKIHESRRNSTMQNVASFSSLESCRSRTTNNSRAFSFRNTRRKIVS